ncbi:hypothetical protein EYF80_029325 [Liparis tanakae]|uniref:Uncharacterized protein n=1 Tax=Liparis tanakae TaxID=230148 RepID=A0A4Z2H6N8_9TELE|nr:hypothetical protein EYF80_029325 [Liparis tanakae]
MLHNTPCSPSHVDPEAGAGPRPAVLPADRHVEVAAAQRHIERRLACNKAELDSPERQMRPVSLNAPSPLSVTHFLAPNGNETFRRQSSSCPLLAVEHQRVREAHGHPRVPEVLQIHGGEVASTGGEESWRGGGHKSVFSPQNVASPSPTRRHDVIESELIKAHPCRRVKSRTNSHNALGGGGKPTYFTIINSSDHKEQDRERTIRQHVYVPGAPGGPRGQNTGNENRPTSRGRGALGTRHAQLLPEPQFRVST